MSATIIDGLALAKSIRADVAQKTAALAARGVVPGLAVILVGDSAASAVYVRNKIKACAEAGVRSIHAQLPADTSEADLLARIDQLNADPQVDGILVQLPLPPQIDSRAVLERISPAKDVDGFHVSNAGALMTGAPLFKPCTPYGVMKMLEHLGTPLRGAHAVVVGASNIVGKPLAMLLLQAGATITICNSKTRDLAAQTRQADVLVAAVGRPNMITGAMVKPGAVVIDVGINRIADGPQAGKLVGDVDFASARDVASAITPVPGGVGPMTIAMLLVNTLESATRRATNMPYNALLDFSSFPAFDRFDPAQIAPAMDVLLAQAQAAVDIAEADTTPASWAAFVEPLESATEKLGRAWSMVGHLNAVADAPPLREAYNANLPRVTQFWTALGQNQKLFAKYRELSASAEGQALDAVRRKILDNALRDFRLGGAELTGEAAKRFAEIQDQQAQLTQKFSENVLDATNAYEFVVEDEAQVPGLPDDVKAAARQAAQAKQKTGLLFSLQMPSYLPFMQYCENRTLREQFYKAYVTRASAHAAAPAEADKRAALDNSGPMLDILKLRREEALLLGYSSYAEVSLVPKMADSPSQVVSFLRDLAARAKPFGQRDLTEMREFASSRLGLDKLESWDTAFVSERLKEARYAFSENEVKQYFQLPRVLDGLFGLIGKLFNVAISADSTATWHPDVRFYRLQRGAQTIGHFYLDLYARSTKRPGAWMDDARSRRKLPAGVQTPIAYLTCNFQAPVGDKPALLTHDDVITLFHEFGHGLHHLLTRVDELTVAGISGVEWDAVELPSQFMENFCWDFGTLSAMTAHVDTQAPLPRELFDKMLAAKNFQAGLQTLRQIEFALFDMRVHSEERALAANGIQTLLDEVRAEVAVLVPPPYNRFQNSFSHIFAGGYAAGYYSYKWAEVLSADCFAAFEEKGLFEPAIGQKFLDEILSVGGSRPAIASFRAFRGRDPSIDALLRHNGMSEDSAQTEPALQA